MNDVITLEFLSARHYGYRLFQRLMGDEPTRDLFSAIDTEITQMTFEVMGIQMNDERIMTFCALLSDAVENKDDIALDYTRIFIGPTSLPAPPWESVYRENQRTIMTKTTLDVRNAYRAQGFIPQLYPCIPDDHIALELDFLASLAADAVKAHQLENSKDCEKFLEASEHFINEHLGIWVNSFAQDMHEKGNSEFYSSVTEALFIFVKADLKNFQCGSS